MSAIDTLIKSSGGSAIDNLIGGSSKSSAIDALILGNPQADKLDALRGQLQVAQANADYASSFGAKMTELGKTVTDIGKTGYEAFTAPLKEAGEAGAEIGTALREKKPVEAVVGGLALGRNIIGAAFAPLSAASAMAEKIPALKPAVDTLNFALGTIPGAVGKFGGSKIADITDHLPMTQEHKTALRNAIEETGSFVGQIWLGAKVIESLGKGEVVDKTKIDELKTEANKLPPPETLSPPPPPSSPIANLTETKPIVPKAETPSVIQEPKTYPKVSNLPEIKQMTITPESKIVDLKTQIDSLQEILDKHPGKTLAKYVSKTTGRLPEVTGKETMKSLTGNGKEVPNSEFGRRGDEIIQELFPNKETYAEAPTIEDAQALYDNYAKVRQNLQDLRTELKIAKGQTFTDYTPEQIDRINNLLTQTTEGARFPQFIQGTGKIVESTRGVDLIKAAVEKDLIARTKDLPTHNAINTKEQADLAVEYALKNPEHAKEVALGEALPPSHIHISALYSAMEEKAIREGDVATIRQLAKSPVPTEAGRSLKLLDSDNPHSPVQILRDLQQAREAKYEKRGGFEKAQKAVVDEIKTEIKKNASKRVSWEQFIKEIQCNY